MRNNERGVVLLMAMWALVMLSVVALNFSLSTRAGSAGARNFKEDTRAYYLAESVYEEAVNYLLSDSESAYDYMDEEGNMRVDDEHPPISGEREVEGAKVVLNITDEQARLNINNIDAATMTKLLEYTGAPTDEVATMMDSLADWMSKGDMARPSGAKDDYYEPFGYKTKPGRLEIVQELLLIKGFTPDYVYGTDRNPGLYPLLTTWGDGSINVNTVSEDLLTALGLSAIEIDGIIGHRPLKSLPGGLRIPAKTTSSFFRIDVATTMPMSTQTVRITAVVKREASKDNKDVYKATPIYWREDVENSGA